MVKLAIAAVIIIALVAAAFVYGPYILEAFVDKLEEWEEIMGDFLNEK